MTHCPYKRLITQSERSLSDAELLAIFFPFKDQVLAKELLKEYGTLQNLLRLPAQGLVLRLGGKPHTVARLKAAWELGRRRYAPIIKPKYALSNQKRAQKFLSVHLRDHAQEVFACAFLNCHYQLLAYEELFFGTIQETMVYPREIVKRGLLLNAAKVILAHNHPSGIATPSQSDLELTQAIQQALSLIDIAVVDHIIVGNPRSFSLSAHGLL